MEKKRPIGVFDSGIGGLSVLKQFIRFLPYEKYIYLGDTARVPYGNRSEEAVKRYSSECTQFLLDHGVKLIVVACNTASSVAIDAIRSISDVPVIGMIQPAASAALRASVNGNIGVIGTRATIGSNAYSNAIFELAGENTDKIKVHSQACPMFVPFVEEGLIRHPATRLIAEEYLNPLKEQNIDTLVLGCTHYPLLSQLLTEMMPGVAQIDSGEHAAVQAVRLLAESDKLVDERNEFIIQPAVDFYVTDIPSTFYTMANSFLGFNVETPLKVAIGKT
jgi:glutamate racemase